MIEVLTARLEAKNTPPQALALFNAPVLVGATRGFALRIL